MQDEKPPMKNYPPPCCQKRRLPSGVSPEQEQTPRVWMRRWSRHRTTEKPATPHRRLAGKKALITGGDSGIGRAVAIAFAPRRG
ncbi:putative oxidoreductase [Klebsiella variicola]|uniref:Putative oxidoreductase n=1 Tax=Klebsiella variicola TaxID=244366 RepID=A0A7H4MKS7_KLEVA|nr:putative oxidoreductase [Klebsiella variicola]